MIYISNMRSPLSPLTLIAVPLLVPISACWDFVPSSELRERYLGCDIREESCIESIARSVANWREGQPQDLPTVEFITKEELMAQQLAEQSELTAEDIASYERYVSGYSLFGLLPEGYSFEEYTLDYYDTVPGYYDYIQKKIVVVSDYRNSDQRYSYELMSHEMVHAMQDAEYDLLTLYEAATTSDRALGLRAIIEGEATTFEVLTGLRLDGGGIHDVNWTRYWNEQQRYVLRQAHWTSIPDVMASRLFPYAFGGEMVFDLWFYDGRSRVDALFASPPESTRQVMAWPGAFWPDGRWNRDQELDLTLVPELPEGWQTETWAHEGVWLIQAMLVRLGGYFEHWHPELADINADALSVHYNTELGSVFAVWRLQFDDDGIGPQLEELFTQHLPENIEVLFLEDADVALVAGAPDGLIDEQTPWRSLEAVRADIPVMAAFSRFRQRGCHDIKRGLGDRILLAP